MSLEQKVMEFVKTHCPWLAGCKGAQEFEAAVRELIQSVRDETLEEAAMECDALGRGDSPTDRLIGYDIAAECIRALRGKPL